MKISGKCNVTDIETDIDTVEGTYVIQSTVRKGNKWVKDRLFFGKTEDETIYKFNRYYMERGFHPEEVEMVL